MEQKQNISCYIFYLLWCYSILEMFTIFVYLSTNIYSHNHSNNWSTFEDFLLFPFICSFSSACWQLKNEIFHCLSFKSFLIGYETLLPFQLHIIQLRILKNAWKISRNFSFCIDYAISQDSCKNNENFHKFMKFNLWKFKNINFCSTHESILKKYRHRCKKVLKCHFEYYFELMTQKIEMESNR